MFEKIFGRSKNLNNLSYDDLMQERTKLELEERKTLKELEKLEKQRNVLFEEAKQSNSNAVRQVKARQIRDLDHRVGAQEGNVRRLGKLLQVVNLTMLQMEKGQLLGSDSPFAKLIANTNSQELQAWLDGNYTEGSVVESKVDDILESMRTSDGMREGGSGDVEIDAIMSEIERASEIDRMSKDMGSSEGTSQASADRTL